MTPSDLLLGYDLPRPGDWAISVNRDTVRNLPEDRQARIASARRKQTVYQRNLFPDRLAQPPITFTPGDSDIIASMCGLTSDRHGRLHAGTCETSATPLTKWSATALYMSYTLTSSDRHPRPNARCLHHPKKNYNRTGFVMGHSVSPLSICIK